MRRYSRQHDAQNAAIIMRRKTRTLTWTRTEFLVRQQGSSWIVVERTTVSMPGRGGEVSEAAVS